MPGADFGARDHGRLSYAVSVDSIAEALRRIHSFLACQTLPRKEKPMSTVTYSVQGMTCGGCAKRVRTALETDLPSLSGIEIDPKAGHVRITADEPVSEDDVRAAVERTGYTFAGLLA